MSYCRSRFAIANLSPFVPFLEMGDNLGFGGPEILPKDEALLAIEWTNGEGSPRV